MFIGTLGVIEIQVFPWLRYILEQTEKNKFAKLESEQIYKAAQGNWYNGLCSFNLVLKHDREILNVLFENTTIELQLEPWLETLNLAHFINCNHNITKSLFD